MAAAAISAQPMAAKKKIKKGKTVSLNDFLSEDGVVGSAQIQTRSINWADESEELDGDASNAWPLDENIYRRIIDRSQLPTAPRAARGPSIDKGRLPSKPPYTAFLGNLPFDVTEECIFTFFTGLKVSSVRLPRELGNSDRLKGFGYAEFDDVESLSNALALNDENLRNRRIRVDIADQSQDKDRDDRGRDRDWARDSSKTEGDWRSRNTENVSPGYRTGRDRFSFDRERGGERDGAFGTRTAFDRSRDGDRFMNARGRDSGGYTDVDGGRRSFMSSFRREVNDSRNDDRQFRERLGDRYERRADYVWRDDSKEDQSCSTETSTVSTRRPRLSLKPRSILKEISMPPPAERTERITSIFGAARPVDTAAREREVEERLRQRGQGLERRVSEQPRLGRSFDRKYNESEASDSASLRLQSWRSNEDGGERRRSSDFSDASRSSRTTSVGSSAGKGWQSRKESEAYEGHEVFSGQEEAQHFKSNQQQPSVPKVVPAPQPRENAWAKRSEMQKRVVSSSVYSDLQADIQDRQPIQQHQLPADSTKTSPNNVKTREPKSVVESFTIAFPAKIIQPALEDSGNEDADWQPEVPAPTKPDKMGVKIKHGSSRSKGRGRGIIAVKKDPKRISVREASLRLCVQVEIWTKQIDAFLCFSRFWQVCTPNSFCFCLLREMLLLILA
uniref:eukaryotic translation initiation factor 4B isoform X2 n=1 Tax=Myxine glutinosa TaxID=7769 RepID=UPI00358EB0CE